MTRTALLRAVPVGLAVLLGAAGPAMAADGGGHVSLGEFSYLWVVPFALLLLSIAVLPLVAGHWWEHNSNRAIVAAVCGVPVLGFLFSTGEPGFTLLGHAGMEYLSFIALLGSLFIISGSILVTGDIRATPRNNVVLLLIGGLLANVVGTTGASMLLIRPLLRINSERKNTMHSVVFFIFVVSNVGGCLTPLGDPPLFLGYLKGVPFFWTMVLWKEWVFMMGALLTIYFIYDTIQYRKETAADIHWDDTRIEPVRVKGGHNFLFLGGVVLTVLGAGEIASTELRTAVMFLAMGGMALLSLKTGSPEIRAKNGFNFHPIAEVAILFAGIFVTMIPALQLLEHHGSELGVTQPWQFFVATGSLSSFLDNAPTYLTFLSVAKTLATPAGMVDVPLHDGHVAENLLIAISLGAVFMGANTYIGNGPNFMVKAIAESAGQKMPSFFGYFGWALCVLGPLFAAVVFLFLV
jgi:Na+/H+ antiporter NhaD/arsenite permease-like protein